MFDPKTLATLERWLQYNIVMVSILGATVLGVGQSSAVPFIVLGLGSPLACFIVDRQQWLALPRLVANIGMILAMVVSLWDFLDNETTVQMMAIANLLVYLQLIMLLQRKSERLYWHLIVLSLLQVVVGAALSVSALLTPLVTVYALLALSCLTIFYVYREAHRIARRVTSDVRAPSTTLEPPVWYRSFRGVVIGMAIVSLIFAQFFLLVAPRSHGSLWNQGAGRDARVGLSNTVTLSDSGKRSMTNAVVMRVYFENAKTGEHYQVFSDPYLQSSILSRYHFKRQGAWKREVTPGNRSQYALQVWDQNDVGDAARIKVAMLPQPQRNLFTMPPTWSPLDGSVNKGLDVRTDYRSGEVFLKPSTASSYRGKLVHYTLVTTGFRNGIQLPLTPHIRVSRRGRPVRGQLAGILSPSRARHYLRMPARGMEGLRAQAVEILGRNQSSNRIFQARALSNHFRTVGEYTYTLDFSRLERLRDKRKDPIEDFVTNHKQGDCRFFASALVMMLRSQGIPARMVVGFRATEYNTMGKFYMVRHRHAHAWVEAYIEPDDIPDGPLLQTSKTWRGGAWLRLDPTPAADVELGMLSPSGGIMLRIRQIMNYLEALWQDYVTGRGQSGALAGADREKVKGVTSPWSLKEWSARITHFFRTLSWIGWVICIFFVALTSVVLLKWLRPFHRQGTVGSTRHPRPRVDFFERLESILAENNLARPNELTPREHMQTLLTRLQHLDGVSGLLNPIIEAYYQVRFGGQDLDSDQREKIEIALSQLDASLTAS